MQATKSNTALYDAIALTCVDIFKTEDSTKRRAIILFTDGDDTFSRFTLKDSIAATQAAGVAVFVIAFDNEASSLNGEVAMKKVAEQTGGAFYKLNKKTKLADVFADIKSQLRDFYLLIYTPIESGKNNERELRVKFIGDKAKQVKTLRFPRTRFDVAPFKPSTKSQFKVRTMQ